MNDERREVRAKIRTYEKDGETKNVYMTIGSAWVSEHGSKISIALDAIPVSQDWDKRLYINKPYEPKAQPQRDKVAEVPDEPINFDNIPF